ncbi:tetratricopeptide repeat (TPR)-like superfamily protein [Tasmannia lanceolata]|uniref:tetratricopeptide repeat (TPR)-like superfamily protein n=1 Tax=Tasmannia lanceolata TaxID=3420 RepID=UPI00406318CE
MVSSRGAHYVSRRLFTALARPTIYETPPSAAQIFLIERLCTKGQLQEALSLFFSLNSQPPSQTYATLLQACAQHRCLREGRTLHHHMLASNHHPDLFVSNHLINMYAKCGCLEFAHQLFDEMPHRNLVSWTALLTGYEQNGRPQDCFRLFARMISHHLPNEFAFASILTSRAASKDGNGGRQVHTLAVKTSFDAYVYVGNALITMYSSCIDSDGGWSIFQTMNCHNLITWNSMIAGFQLCGRGDRSLELFSRMHREGIGFDRATLVSVISSCSDNALSSLEQCQQLHSLVTKSGFVSELEIGTSLVKAYSKFGGSAHDCYRVFSETKHRDIVSWTGIITSCAEREPEEALFLFGRLWMDGLEPDRYTFSIIVKACAALATEHHGLAVHGQIVKAGFEDDVVLANALVHAYARCGAIDLSERVFDQMPVRDTVSWNSMIKAYAIHGQGNEALKLFEQMNIQPDGATFVGLLSACSHAGLLNQGIEIFDTMLKNYEIAPQREHYACAVDILGRAGRLTEAEELVNQMPMEPDSVVWSALLGACRKHGETKIAERASRKLIELEPTNSIGYILMSNIYCAKGSFTDAGFIRKEMKYWRTKKEPGLSWIEIGNRVHEFAAGGRRHPQREAIYAEVEGLVCRLKAIGYVPETSLVLHEVEEEHKEEQLYYHSEKLALAFGLMMTVTSTACIRIMKNIRICVDCHNFIKLASNCVGREIVVRDANRFHHFRDGLCSCSDYW